MALQPLESGNPPTIKGVALPTPFFTDDDIERSIWPQDLFNSGH